MAAYYTAEEAILRVTESSGESDIEFTDIEELEHDDTSDAESSNTNSTDLEQHYESPMRDDLEQHSFNYESPMREDLPSPSSWQTPDTEYPTHSHLRNRQSASHGRPTRSRGARRRMECSPQIEPRTSGRRQGRRGQEAGRGRGRDQESRGRGRGRGRGEESRGRGRGRGRGEESRGRGRGQESRGRGRGRGRGEESRGRGRGRGRGEESRGRGRVRGRVRGEGEGRGQGAQTASWQSRLSEDDGSDYSTHDDSEQIPAARGSNTSEVTWEAIDPTTDRETHTYHFAQASGPKLSLGGDVQPYDIYNHFLGQTFIDMLVSGTNEYADKKIAALQHRGNLTPGSRWNKWKPVSAEEMRAVLAIVINMGVLSSPDLEGYWKTAWECYIPYFHDVMGRNRFQEIFWNLHIPPTPGSTLRVDKVQLLLQHIKRMSQAAFYPGQELAVDETMVGFRGRVSFMQYCPKKPTKFGLKLYVLADSSTGYMYDFILYTGSEVTSMLPQAYSHLPIPGQFVTALVDSVMDRGHVVYTDRFYTSVPLAETLERRGTGLVGTLVKNRKGLPPEVRSGGFKMKTNEVKAWRNDNKLVVAWRHNKKKPVVMLSTTHSAAPTTVPAGRRRQPVTKPAVIIHYNGAMDGVDRADQYCVYYSFIRKSVKWWRKILFWAIEVGIVNSYILYKQIADRPIAHLQFRREIIKGLCSTFATGNVRIQRMRAIPEERFQGRHYIAQGDSRRRCVVCGTAKSGTRKPTVFYCKTCSCNPPLHPIPCFEKYHETRQYISA